jgi:hypothetical protein
VKNVPRANFLSEFETLDVLLDIGVQNGVSVAQWNVNSSMINVDWMDPTLAYVASDNTTYPDDLNLIQLPTANTVSPILQSPLKTLARLILMAKVAFLDHPSY